MKNLENPKILANNINNKKSKILEYIDDHNIVYGDKKSTKAELEDATKRIESYPKKMSKQDEYNIYFNKKSPKYYAKKPKPKPKPIPFPQNADEFMELSDWLEILDPGGWASDEDKRVEAESLYEKYLELLKGGELLPGTTFQMFESNPMGYDIDAIAKINKIVNEKKKAEGLATLLGVSPEKI